MNLAAIRHRSTGSDCYALDESTVVLNLWTDRGVQAVTLVCEEFGFDKEKVTVVRTVGKYEIDTNSRRLRLVGETERKPLYNATDFNYVRFDCAGWFYEMYNGELRKYYC